MPALMQFGGEERFLATVEKLYFTLTTPTEMAATIPDLESYELIESGGMLAVVKPGFSFLRGTLKLEIAFVDLQPPAENSQGGQAAMRVIAKGIGATIEMLSRTQLEPEASGCLLKWEAEIQRLQGLVATVSKPLIQAAAGQVAQRAWQKIRERVEQP